jgi:hypothetical protein
MPQWGRTAARIPPYRGIIETRLIPLHTAMRSPFDSFGFHPPADRGLGQERRTATCAALAATLALALSTVVVATVLSVGIASANVVDGVIGNEGSLFAIALLLGLLFVGIGGYSILPGDKAKK